MTNRYSDTWFGVFLDTIPEEQTAAEIAFLQHWLPLPAYRTVLDLGCGSGRHARPLGAAGYAVTGLDSHPAALAAARQAGGAGVAYVAGDIRALAGLPGPCDAVISLWQSFGYFDPATNAAVLAGIARTLRPGGRFVLVEFHPAFFAAHQEPRTFRRGGRTIGETGALIGHRLTVRLDYGPDRAPDVFAWELYTPDEIVALAREVGLGCWVACTGFAEDAPPAAESPRMQFVFEKDAL